MLQPIIRPAHVRWVYALAGLAVFVSALIYYIILRTQLPWPGYWLNLSWALVPSLSDITLGAYPSFAFTLSFGLCAIALFFHQRRTISVAILGVWFIGLLHEVSLGTYDSLDILFGSLGACLALLIATFATLPKQHRNTAFSYARATGDNRFTAEGEFNRETTNRQDRGKLIAMMLVSLSCATATSEYSSTDVSNCIQRDENGTCVERKKDGTPVYLSYADLRSAVEIEPARELARVSRIYLYKNYIFINAQNQGIYVIDNTTPTAPENVAFIRIPGNTEISIRSDYLYADSYIDLVTLDVSDINNIEEVAREEAIFPYNARQNIPNDVSLIGEIDSNRGVVVGYRL